MYDSRGFCKIVFRPLLSAYPKDHPFRKPIVTSKMNRFKGTLVPNIFFIKNRPTLLYTEQCINPNTRCDGFTNCSETKYFLKLIFYFALKHQNIFILKLILFKKKSLQNNIKNSTG
jgi:hypothetical protein